MHKPSLQPSLLVPRRRLCRPHPDQPCHPPSQRCVTRILCSAVGVLCLPTNWRLDELPAAAAKRHRALLPELADLSSSFHAATEALWDPAAWPSAHTAPELVPAASDRGRELTRDAARAVKVSRSLWCQPPHPHSHPHQHTHSYICAFTRILIQALFRLGGDAVHSIVVHRSLPFGEANSKKVATSHLHPLEIHRPFAPYL